MKPLLLMPIAALASLAACVAPSESCSSYGFEPGTEAYANCVMQVDQANQERRQRAAASLNALNSQPFPQPRLQTRCIRNAYGYTCY